MREVLKTYQVELLVKGPVYVGSGKDIGKKEYVYLDKSTIGVLAVDKFYQAMRKKGKVRQFEEYLLNNTRDDLSSWLMRERLHPTDFKDCIRYSLKCRELIEARQNRSQLQILECIKDPYGLPYIPGSSLKGMFRTILLGDDIIKNPNYYRQEKDAITKEVFAYDSRKPNRTTFLKRNMNDVEMINYRNDFQREKSQPNDAVNDIMQGFIVSDSEPLSLDDLTLCQVVELHTDGEEKTLNVLRECIKPGSKIRFTITIDQSEVEGNPLCRFTKEDIEDAIATFANQLNVNFGKKFPGLDRMRDNQVLLGGGAGFLSKTIIYPMYGYDEGIKVTQKIFDKTGVTFKHKHNNDQKYGASPHIMKSTRYQGKLCKMGLCELRFLS